MKFPALNSTLMLALTLLLALFGSIMATMAYFRHPADSDDQRALTTTGVHSNDALFVSRGNQLTVTSGRTFNTLTGDRMQQLITFSAPVPDGKPFDLHVKNLQFEFEFEYTSTNGVVTLPKMVDELGAAVTLSNGRGFFGSSASFITHDVYTVAILLNIGGAIKVVTGEFQRGNNAWGNAIAAAILMIHSQDGTFNFVNKTTEKDFIVQRVQAKDGVVGVEGTILSIGGVNVSGPFKLRAVKGEGSVAVGAAINTDE